VAEAADVFGFEGEEGALGPDTTVFGSGKKNMRFHDGGLALRIHEENLGFRLQLSMANMK
jgi:hypothetical protein